jgi:flagellar hook-basal body complex protein FliE
MDIKQAASAYGSIANIVQNNITPVVPDTASTAGPSFSDMVSKALANAVDSGHKAEEVSTLALMGKADITELATAVSSAELALNTVVAIRDKVITAYQQIMQMPI